MANIRYTKEDIINALRSSGLQEGDTAYFSTSLGMIGIAEGVKNQTELNKLFFDSFREVLGEEGTIVVPTYSYTIGGSTPENPKVYDPQETPAEIGPFPNFFMEQEGVIRSLDPMVSMAALGPNAEALFSNIPPTSYGKDSVYERLINIPNSKCVSVGLGPNWTPFIHYADWLMQVPHRYDKLFYGGTKHPNGDITYGYWVYSVRAAMDASWADAHKLGKMAAEAQIWHYAPLARARVYTASYKDYFDFAIDLMKKDKWLMARGPECDVLKAEMARKPKTIEAAPDSIKRSGTDLKEYLKNIPRDVMGDGISFIIRYLSNLINLRTTAYSTGMHIYDWIVPEWRCQDENGTSFGMGEMHTAEYIAENNSQNTNIIVCYIDEELSPNLEELVATLNFIDKIKENGSEINWRVALVPGHIGFAGYMETIREIKTECIYHLCNGNGSILKSGNNPLADEKLSDMPHRHKIITTKDIDTLK